MRRTIGVLLGDGALPVGSIRADVEGARETAAFAYDASWLASPDRFALDPTLTLVAGPQFPSRRPGASIFPPAIADAEPDGWAKRVIQRDRAHRREESRRSGAPAEPAVTSSIDLLLAVDDFSRVGAARFRDEAGIIQRAPEPGRRTAPPLVELGMLLAATRAVEANSETAADLEYLRGRGTSVGGVRPKCTLVDDDGRLAIGKFPSLSDERPVTKGEVLALEIAAAVGIDAAAARLVDSQGVPVAVIRRFDRPEGGGRIAYLSAAAMLGIAGADEDEHAYTEIVDALRVHGAAPQQDIEELWRRIVFSILITNVDDHLRNHGFLHAARGRWRLSPAFDLNPFPDRARQLKTWITEDSGPAATIDAALEAAPAFGIALPSARAMLGPIERAVGRWRQHGQRLGMTRRELEQFAGAFEHRERAAARRASG